MPLSRLIIRDFRNIENADLTFSPQFNFIVGDNGSGKTNLLEAIYLLGHGRAFRQSQSQRVIRHEQPELVLHGKIALEHTEHRIGLSKSRQSDNKVKIDGSEGHRIAELAQLLPIQLITPEGFELLTGGPKFRRTYIDWGCFYDYPAFFNAWNNVRHLLKQRNAALRQVSSYSQLRHWDQALVQYATQVTEFRQTYVAQIQETITRLCHIFLPEYTLDCRFYAGWDIDEDFAALLEKQFPRDKQLNYTSLGPHKADLRLRVNNVPVDALFSRGQLKLLMCALRLAQGEYLTEKTRYPCVYLLDDFASELDPHKRALLATQLKQTHSQVFISAIELSQISEMVGENDKIFYVNCGKIDAN